MYSKGEATRRKIIDTAKALFASHGYAAVTMKDVCDHNGLSRGGLYRHFASTKAIFLAMLERDMQADSQAIQRAIGDKVPPHIVLDHYMAHERAEIFSDARGLYFAVHEFAFLEAEERQRIDTRMQASVALIAELLAYGQRQDSFQAFDARNMALHIVCTFDALKTSAPILTITEEMVDGQIQLMKGMIMQ